jgi:hypothetical protein
MHFSYFLCSAAADPPPAQRADETDDDHKPERPMDFDEAVTEPSRINALEMCGDIIYEIKHDIMILYMISCLIFDTISQMRRR